MRRELKPKENAARDLRTRYVPGIRLRHGVLSFAPWVDLLLVLVFLVMLQSRIVLQPGVVVELPAGNARGTGLRSSMIAVVTMTGNRAAPIYKVFFDNEQYLMSDADRMDALKFALTAHRQWRGEQALTLYADRRIEHGALTRLVLMAQDAGVLRVNFGTRPVDGE